MSSRFCCTLLLTASVLFSLVTVARTQSREDLSALVDAVGTPLTTSFKKAKAISTESACMLRMELGLQRLETIRTRGRDLREIYSGVIGDLEKCRKSMKRIRELDSKAPDFEKIAGRAIRATPELYRVATEKDPKFSRAESQDLADLLVAAAAEFAKFLWNYWSLSEERAEYAGHYRRARLNHVGAIAHASRKRFAEVARVPGAIGFAVDGSWCNTFEQDWVQFQNKTGKTLRNCILFVSLHGKNAVTGDAERDRHLHFIARWEPGEWKVARYASRLAEGFVTNESVDCLHEMHVELMCDDLTCSTTYDYIGAPFDADVERYVEKWVRPTFYGGFSPFKEGLLFDDTAQIRLQYTSARCDYMPLQGAKAVLTQGGKKFRRNLTLGRKRIESGTTLGGLTWTLPSLDEVRASRLEMTLEFPYSSYTKKVVWNY